MQTIRQTIRQYNNEYNEYNNNEYNNTRLPDWPATLTFRIGH